MDKVFIFDVDGTLTPSRLPMTTEFREFFLEFIWLPNFISRSKFPEIAFTVEETADLNLSFKSSCSSIKLI